MKGYQRWAGSGPLKAPVRPVRRVTGHPGWTEHLGHNKVRGQGKQGWIIEGLVIMFR